MCLCPRINSFPWRNPQGQPGFVIYPAAFKQLLGEILLHALLTRAHPAGADLGTDGGALPTAAPAQLCCGSIKAATCACAPSLVTNASLGGHNLGIPVGWWLQATDPLGRGQRSPVPACLSPSLGMAWVTGRWLRVASHAGKKWDGKVYLALPLFEWVAHPHCIWLCNKRQSGAKQGIRKSPWKGSGLWQINTNEAL